MSATSGFQTALQCTRFIYKTSVTKHFKKLTTACSLTLTPCTTPNQPLHLQTRHLHW